MEQTLTDNNLRLTCTYLLTAAECGAQGSITPALMTERIIEIATQHANLLHIGYADLSKHNIGWVLSRMSLRMEQWPRYNKHFTIQTWIEDVNRLYSTRCMRILDDNGNTIGEARTIWAAINTATRTPADISILDLDKLILGTDGITVPRPGRIPPCGQDAVRTSYTWRYSDIDINRHVNSVRYIETILDVWSLEHFDTHRIAHIDIIYQHECLFGEEVDVAVKDRSDDNVTTASDVELLRDDKRVCAAHIVWHTD